MKATELRIGNMVQGGTVSGIHQVFNDEPYTIEIKDQEGMFSELDISEVQPIPISEEWLKKIGFFHDGQTSGRLKIDCDLGVSMIPLKPPLLPLCKYVHQLQNLYFALTGNELIIKQPA